MKRLLTAGFILLLFGVCAGSAHANDLFTAPRSKIDAVTASGGYVSVTFTGSTTKRLKVQVAKDGGTSYNYDLPGNGQTIQLPLQMGNGSYTVSVLENVSGDNYAMIQTAKFNLTLRSANAPYLVRSQIINFTASSRPVQSGNDTLRSVADIIAKVDRAYNLVADTMAYDYDKAKTVETGYVPVLDTVWNARKGICYDYSACMVAMLRAQGIPARLVMGYAYNGVYHAWVEVYVDRSGTIATGSIGVTGGTFVRLDPTFLSTGKKSADTLKYINNAANYQPTKYY